MLSRDTFVVLGQAATQTSRLTLFPAVTNPFTRDASVLAGAIQTVEELAPGRVKFVIGTGYTSASTIGRKPATLAEMRACIADREGAAGRTGRWTSAATPGRLGYASGRPHPGADGRVGAESHRARRRGRRRRAAARRLQPRHRRARARAPRARREARRAGASRIWRSSGRCASAPRPRIAEARRLARPTAVHWGVLRWGGYWLEPAGAHAAPARGAGRRAPDLSRSLPRPRLGGGHRARRRSCPTRSSPSSATRSA